ncbi:MAG: ribosome biogenesis factor YjgA [Desulfovibrio sp.]
MEETKALKSRSQKKRDMTALQELGEQLAALTRSELRPLDLPPDLLDALDELRRLTRHEARRRQNQFVGKLMRTLDPEPIMEFLDSRGAATAEANALFHGLERLRDRLLDGEDEPLEEFFDAHPGADRQHLRGLVRNARQERAKDKPPKSARALFRALREAAQD